MSSLALRHPAAAKDGFGEQYKMILLTMFFAERHGFRYIYETPPAMQHNYENEPDFIACKERLWNLEQFRGTGSPITLLSVSIPDLLHYWETNLEHASTSKALQLAGQLFFEANEGPDEGVPVVAIHIRRPNEHDFGVRSFEVPLSVYLEIFQYLQKTYGTTHQLTVVSQGRPTEEFFQGLTKAFPGIRLIVDESVENAFCRLVYADVLVMAPSALSYVAGLLRKPTQICYYIQHCNPPLPHWRRIFGYESNRRHYEYLYSMAVLFNAAEDRFFADPVAMPVLHQRIFQEVARSLPLPASTVAKPELWPFNGNPDFGDYVKMWVDRFQVRGIIETGTFLGSTTGFFAALPALQVHSIEIQPDYLDRARKRLAVAAAPHLHLHLGDSRTILPVILQSLAGSGFLLFYLDAHWNDEYVPLFTELEIIAKHVPNECLIVIDDMQVPDRPDIPYDSFQGRPFSLELVEPYLAAVFPAGYHAEIYAPPPRLAKTRGRLLVWPASSGAKNNTGQSETH